MSLALRDCDCDATGQTTTPSSSNAGIPYASTSLTGETDLPSAGSPTCLQQVDLGQGEARSQELSL